VSTVASQPAFPIQIPRQTLLSRYYVWRNRAPKVTIERVLAAAEAGELDHFLNRHYTIYYHEHWKDKLELCRDLVEAGYLKAEFKNDFDGSPMFFDGEPRITVAGREHLAEIRERKLSRRLWSGSLIFISGIVSTLAVQLIQGWIESGLR
jgi:hypothetical protein